MADERYIEKHGLRWRVRVKVPTNVRHVLKKSKLMETLPAKTLGEAQAQRWEVLARLKARITAAERQSKTQGTSQEAALQYREDEDQDAAAYAAHEEAKRIEKKDGYRKAKEFYDLATGQRTPLDLYSTEFSKHQGYRLKSEGDYLRVLGWLGDWMTSKQGGASIEAVDRKTAGEFISKSLLVGRSHSKASAYLGFLRQYWRWLQEKGHVEHNPWVGQSLPAAPRVKRDAQPDHGKRPFTDNEIKTLLEGDPGPLLADLMRIAALSGMRLEEICQLHVSDTTGDNFNVWAGKTDNARRTVPIHPDLKRIIERRSKGKKPSAFLFEDLPPLTESRETRSDPAAKRFTRYRRSRKVDERPNEKQKSNVDFHSFRRWFIRKVRDASLAGNTAFDAWTLAWVVGHSDSERPKSLELSQHGYAGQDPEKAKRALVEAVTLPNVAGSQDTPNL